MNYIKFNFFQFLIKKIKKFKICNNIEKFAQIYKYYCIICNINEVLR